MAVVTTGFFDGVHLGHRRVIETLVSSARQKGEEAIVVTFAKHPRAVLQKDARSLRLLSAAEEKLIRIKSLGVDRVELLDFSKSFAQMSSAQYISELLQSRLGASSLVLGYDNRVGSDQRRACELGELTARLGLELEVVPASLLPDGTPISSTKIRHALGEGRVEEAAAMLGYDYSLKGVVVGGKQLGRTIGFPTANMQLYDPLKLYPAKGVYLTEVSCLGSRYYGMTNVGDIVETHIFDFCDDIYGLDLEIQFKKRLRDMRRFESLSDLKMQLAIDQESCAALCEGRPRP